MYPPVRPRCVAVAALLALALLAAGGVSRAAADSLEAEVREIGRLLKCPVCQSVSVADSQSELAQQMRGVIRQQLTEGRTRQEIIAYFVERYGESVLFEPPKRGFSLLAWLVTPLAVAAGGLAVWRIVRRRGRPAPQGEGAAVMHTAGSEADLERYRERLRAELAEEQAPRVGRR